MAEETLETLLEQLNRGDMDAAASLFRIYGPYLRMVVRRQLNQPLRGKFDSMDIVQSVWADMVPGFQQGRWQFNHVEELRAFLLRAIRNRFIDRLRQNQPAISTQENLPPEELATLPAAKQPEVDDLVAAEETWERLLLLCPPQHRDLLQMKRQGLSPAELAQRSGLHESSIRRIFYTLARRFARLETANRSEPGG